MFYLGKTGAAIPRENAFVEDLVLDPVHQVVDVVRSRQGSWFLQTEKPEKYPENRIKQYKEKLQTYKSK